MVNKTPWEGPKPVMLTPAGNGGSRPQWCKRATHREKARARQVALLFRESDSTLGGGGDPTPPGCLGRGVPPRGGGGMPSPQADSGGECPSGREPKNPVERPYRASSPPLESGLLTAKDPPTETPSSDGWPGTTLNSDGGQSPTRPPHRPSWRPYRSWASPRPDGPWIPSVNHWRAPGHVCIPQFLE